MACILTLDGALAWCSAGVVRDGQVVSERVEASGQGSALPVMAREVLLMAGKVGAGQVDMVAVTVGPGSFTGLRAALALAHGIGLAAGIPVVGVTVGEALARWAPPGRAFWAATDSKRGRVFLEWDGAVRSLALDALPAPAGKVAVAGDAAIAVASRLAAKDFDVRLLDARRPDPLGIALAAQRGGRPAQPLYVDPPAVRPGPAGRPAPA
jgi:tRNA threonylcarbamoyladenosine biosynthesis protein TsaB